MQKEAVSTMLYSDIGTVLVHDEGVRHYLHEKTASYSCHVSIIDCDPGIDDAVALALALFDPRLEVLAVTACSESSMELVAPRICKQLSRGWIPPSILA